MLVGWWKVIFASLGNISDEASQPPTVPVFTVCMCVLKLHGINITSHWISARFGGGVDFVACGFWFLKFHVDSLLLKF